MVDTKLEKSRRLTSEEEVVLDAIIEQGYKHMWGIIFEYDAAAAQKHFAETGIAIKHRIDINNHLEIILKLIHDHIIDADYIIDVTFANNVRSVYNPNNLPPIKSGQRYFWAMNTKWAYETYQLNGLIGIEECAEKLGSKICIRMSADDIERINKNYRASHVVQLKLNTACLCLMIKIDGDWKELPRLHEDKIPFQVLRYAYKNHDKIVTRDELEKRNIELNDKYLESQVFGDNGTVKALSPLFLKLTKNSIMFVAKPIKITLNELNKLKADLKIF